MKFGVYIRPAVTYDKMLDLAKHVEDLDYYGVFLNEHIHGLSPDRLDPYLEAWTAMTGIGAQTNIVARGFSMLHPTLFNPSTRVSLLLR